MDDSFVEILCREAVHPLFLVGDSQDMAFQVVLNETHSELKPFHIILELCIEVRILSSEIFLGLLNFIPVSGVNRLLLRYEGRYLTGCLVVEAKDSLVCSLDMGFQLLVEVMDLLIRRSSIGFRLLVESMDCC